MGMFVNSDHSAFKRAVNSKIYVDKTGLISELNSVLDTEQCCICNSRPRRFGKSMTANMLAAYYSRGSNSRELFSGLAISECEDFELHLNQYDVIHWDIQWCVEPAGGVQHVIEYITEKTIKELRMFYPDDIPVDIISLPETLSQINAAQGKRFIIIIDEWDVLIRDESANYKIQEEYINFLKTLFKGSEPTKYIRLAYLTGILPIKKAKTQSALNNFEEFTMISPGQFAPYIGFTETEVQSLCEKYEMDYSEVKRWYDGYKLGKEHIYNPQAVVSVMLRQEFQSYWSQTGTYESILPIINMNFDGLKSSIIQMISGMSTEVNVSTFQNDMVSFINKDDVITLLIHLGYLAYDRKKRVAYIPNEEIRQEFLAATQKNQWNELLNFQQESRLLLKATLDMECDEVSSGIEKIHTQFVSSIQYNDENSLSSVLTIAYLSAMQYYFIPIRELPTGRGFADYIYLPKPEYKEELPALLVELKWNKKACSALEQINERDYVQRILSYTDDILLVGITYDKKTKKHECVIKKYGVDLNKEKEEV